LIRDPQGLNSDEGGRPRGHALVRYSYNAPRAFFEAVSPARSVFDGGKLDRFGVTGTTQFCQTRLLVHL